MNIAILISGHIRDCNTDNINENIINTLKSSGYNVDVFVSTWSINERRLGGAMYLDDKVTENISKLNPVKIEIEDNKRHDFLHRYKSVILHQHMSTETCADAVSQLYKLYKCIELMRSYSNENNKKYDIVIKIRPDIIYFNKISITDIDKCLNNNCVYMAEWHKRYENVTMKIMDCFFFGNIEVMNTICNSYQHIPEYIDRKTPDTAEAFIYNTIDDNKYSISRTDIKYGVLRRSETRDTYIEFVTI